MERPILFSGPMVRAILDGRKTVTRRIVRGVVESGGAYSTEAWERGEMPRCPFGSSGDRLWVRETWMPRAAPCGLESFSNGVIYAATPNAGGGYAVHARESHADQIARLSKPGFTWRPSIHMPRWASRLTLEVVGVRVERLQEIDEADILAEGVTVDGVAKLTGTPWADMPTLHHAWERLWDSINGDSASWASNPWVWRVEFRRVQP